DSLTGQVTEDFRSEVLGGLGASPNNQDLYKKALLDRDYQRTEREIAEALERACQASEALRTMAQDLEGFNLAHYATLRGQFTLEDLRDFCQVALPRLGGSMLPDGEFYRIDTPPQLRDYPRIEHTYHHATFDRKLAMRRKQARLLGTGHPLIDALFTELQKDDFAGALTDLAGTREAAPCLRVHCVAHVSYEDGKSRCSWRSADLHPDGSWAPVGEESARVLLGLLRDRPNTALKVEGPAGKWVSAYGAATGVWESELRGREDGVLAVRFVVVGVALKR
ncbi:MAG: hypothetical protein HYW07_17615, partial [Candidatus Latescibacteria bacterium]|nr:hypothetical protein [Candidatus Latescibacterota bacterium]